MHKNPVWLTFLALAFMVVLWFTGNAIWQVYSYSQLKARTVVTMTEWSSKELSADIFAPYATYQFEVDHKIYTGQEALRYPRFRNAKSVEEENTKLVLKQWKVWYDPTYPQHSTLQKKFPTRESVWAGILIVLFVYFIGLGFYVTKKQADG